MNGDTPNTFADFDIAPGTEEAEALCFLYANSDYGFKPEEMEDNTDLANPFRALMRLREMDLIGKTADGYYHALDDPFVTRYTEELAPTTDHTIDTGKEPYPESE